jgi:MoaA/NifB/PqqE/SkfB family radical SAM enzyme
MRRKIYSAVITDKLRRLDLGWFFSKAATYLWLKLEGLLKTGFAPPPLACGLEVTENCNMRCPACILPLRYQKHRRNEPTAKWRLVIDQLQDLGIGGIAISGGEPTLRADVFELLGRAARRGTAATLNSNLCTLSQAQIDELLRTDFDNINVSFDSGREDVTDRLRGGKKVLARITKNIQALVAARKAQGRKFSLTAVTTLGDLNLDDLDALFAQVKRAGADRICFIPLHDIRDGVTYLVHSKKVRPDLFAALKRLSARHGLPLENSDHYLQDFHRVMTGGVMPVRCNAGYTHLVVGSDLKIYRCIPFMNMGLHLFQWDPEQQTLKALWNSPAWRRDRVEALTCKQCFWDCHAEVSYLVRM